MIFNRAVFENKKCLNIGLAGTGKTFLAKVISQMFKTVVYTPHPEEWKDTNALIFLVETDYITDFSFWCEQVKRMKGAVELFIIDEMDLLFKSQFDVPDPLKDLIINHRHYNLALLGISKRPQNIPTQVYGEFEIICAFSIDSPQVQDLFNRYEKDLGDLVASLPYKSYKFAFKHIGQPTRVLKV